MFARRFSRERIPFARVLVGEGIAVSPIGAAA
jgi:hypothetical protein